MGLHTQAAHASVALWDKPSNDYSPKTRMDETMMRFVACNGRKLLKEVVSLTHSLIE